MTALRLVAAVALVVAGSVLVWVLPHPWDLVFIAVLVALVGADRLVRGPRP